MRWQNSSNTTVRIELSASHRFAGAVRRIRRIAASIGLDSESDSWWMKADSARLRKFVAGIRTDRLRARGVLEVRVFEEVEEEECSSGWFRMRQSRAEMHSTRANPRDGHFRSHFDAERGIDLYAASDQFRHVVKASRLRGLHFVLHPDSKSVDTTKWFDVFAGRLFGRGTHHPLADHRKIVKSFWAPRKVPPQVVGLNSFSGQVIDPRSLEGHGDLQTLFGLCRPRNLDIVGIRRFVRERIPKGVDFCFLSPLVEDDRQFDEMGRTREIACNDRARRTLVRKRLMRPEQFEPLLVIGVRDVKGPILDDSLRTPLLPRFTAAERRTVELNRLAGFNRSKRSLRKSLTLRKILAELTAMTRTLPVKPDVKYGGRRAAKLPSRLRSLLDVAPDRLPMTNAIGDAFAFGFIRIVPTQVRVSTRYVGKNQDPLQIPSTQDIAFAQNMIGDWFSTRAGPHGASDERIVLWNHETLAARETWPDVRSFGVDLLAASRAGNTD